MVSQADEREDLRQGKGWFAHKWNCPKRHEHTPGFDTASDGSSPTLNGKRIVLTGSKATHRQLKCSGCDLYVILEPVS